ncbi:hypothetical protein HDE_01046 [Halotydeus destructor]|nr:hypothetical protein HDE_01046 [Halotydeus destructor]
MRQVTAITPSQQGLKSTMYLQGLFHRQSLARVLLGLLFAQACVCSHQRDATGADNNQLESTHRRVAHYVGPSPAPALGPVPVSSAEPVTRSQQRQSMYKTLKSNIKYTWGKRFDLKTGLNFLYDRVKPFYGKANDPKHMVGSIDLQPPAESSHSYSYSSPSSESRSYSSSSYNKYSSPSSSYPSSSYPSSSYSQSYSSQSSPYSRSPSPYYSRYSSSYPPSSYPPSPYPASPYPPSSYPPSSYPPSSYPPGSYPAGSYPPPPPSSSRPSSPYPPPSYSRYSYQGSYGPPPPPPGPYASASSYYPAYAVAPSTTSAVATSPAQEVVDKSAITIGGIAYVVTVCRLLNARDVH